MPKRNFISGFRLNGFCPKKVSFRPWACQRAGVQGLWFRDSRHEASTQLAKVLENPMDLAKVTGHKDLKTLLNVYYNPTGDELAEKLRAKK